jgi:hypothetical protein
MIETVALAWQDEYHECDEDVVVVIGGVAGGKTRINCEIVTEQVFQYPKARHYIMGATRQTLKDGTLKDYLFHLDEWGIAYEQNLTSLAIKIKSGPGAGAEIIVWTARQFRLLKGHQIDFMWGDEAQEWERGDEVYDFITTRIRPSPEAQKFYPGLRPRLRISANPPHTKSHWLYKYFVRKQVAKTFHVTTKMNTLLGTPEQREVFYANLRKTLDPAKYAIEVEGKWGEIGVGLAYTSFDENRNTANADQIALFAYDPSRPILVKHDFGVTPRVAILSQRFQPPEKIPGLQDEVLFTFGEITVDPGSTYKLIDELVLRLEGKEVHSLEHYGDPAGTSRNSTTGLSDWAMLKQDERLAKYKNTFHHRQPGRPLIVDRVSATNARLSNADDEVGWLIHPDCEKLLEDLASTKFIDGTRQLDHGSPSNGIKRTHWSDAGGYGIEFLWPIVVPTPLTWGKVSTARK